MPFLHNRVSQAELKEKMLREPFSRTTISFYRYFPIENPLAFRHDLYKRFQALDVFGRIYVAHEGINAQVSVPDHHLAAWEAVLETVPGLSGIRLNKAPAQGNDPISQGKSFWVLKIKVRDKIVADGIDDPSFSMENKGKYVDAKGLHQLMEDPKTVLVDMRNHYEYEVGHFKGAQAIPSDTFREQLPMAVDLLKGKEEENIVMYCTGGIRCEKASAYLLHKGFKNVYHVEGGIIHYARQAKEAGLPSAFVGKNFVFDDRLGERITPDVIAHCHQCGQPADAHTNCQNQGCHLLFIQCEACAEKMQGTCSPECLETLDRPAERRAALQAEQAAATGSRAFNKSSARLRPRLMPDGKRG